MGDEDKTRGHDDTPSSAMAWATFDARRSGRTCAVGAAMPAANTASSGCCVWHTTSYAATLSYRWRSTQSIFAREANNDQCSQDPPPSMGARSCGYAP
ncbi:hypothetical protein JG688_00011328 [Phytophthora aleatoria]|uniref:Uncharacterized protein n=1 Tax=Phytophthora aleatoria TaxID=2496075 RepID=A0A8J5IMF6_9STRA|nr:hypothetical protein JG688_00011328 [Phytophthora aleatoria]